jgi:hypothetical protein
MKNASNYNSQDSDNEVEDFQDPTELTFWNKTEPAFRVMNDYLNTLDKIIKSKNTYQYKHDKILSFLKYVHSYTNLCSKKDLENNMTILSPGSYVKQLNDINGIVYNLHEDYVLEPYKREKNYSSDIQLVELIFFDIEQIFLQYSKPDLSISLYDKQAFRSILGDYYKALNDLIEYYLSSVDKNNLTKYRDKMDTIASRFYANGKLYEEKVKDRYNIVDNLIQESLGKMEECEFYKGQLKNSGDIFVSCAKSYPNKLQEELKSYYKAAADSIECYNTSKVEQGEKNKQVNLIIDCFNYNTEIALKKLPPTSQLSQEIEKLRKSLESLRPISQSSLQNLDVPSGSLISHSQAQQDNYSNQSINPPTLQSRKFF